MSPGSSGAISEPGAPEGCFVCAKHRRAANAEGGVIFEDELVYAGHAHRMGAHETYLGHLIAEPKRHVRGLGELTDAEAAALGRLTNDLGRALRATESAEQVYSFVVGDGPPDHLHVHVVARYPGTPHEFTGFNVFEWVDAPRGGTAEMTAVCDRIRAVLLRRS
jgi:diadenosine tetraphosphate (Ap4A) HIT family hydrolase